ncbi:MAG: hypothetical protein IJL57_07430 [Bacteroidales bacterium]|nr:hypothetical protein [Bacteroidales bacterium]
MLTCFVVFRRGFRLADVHTGEMEVPPRLTASAEWCAPPGEKGGKDGRRERGSYTTGTLFPPPIFSPLTLVRGTPFRQ